MYAYQSRFRPSGAVPPETAPPISVGMREDNDNRSYASEFDPSGDSARAVDGAPIRETLGDDEEADSPSLTVMTRKIHELQLALPRLAKERGIRLYRVEPLDESLESVFSYLVDG